MVSEQKAEPMRREERLSHVVNAPSKALIIGVDLILEQTHNSVVCHGLQSEVFMVIP